MPKIERAIIMAAGKGTRLYPLTEETPKPLLPVRGVPMIEGIIQTLIARGITDIVVVVGYKAEQFGYLAEKYGIRLVLNPDYETANNISSLYYAKDYLENVVILDGDQIIRAPMVVMNSVERSGYACWWNEDATKEWLLSLDQNKRVLSCSRDGGSKGWQLMSLSYWIGQDCTVLRRLVEEAYVHRNIRDVYWDDIAMFLYPEAIPLYGFPIAKGDIIEIDSVAEYEAANGRQ